MKDGDIMMEALTIENDLDWLRQVSVKVDIKNDNLEEALSVLDSYCLMHGVFAMAAVQLGINKRIIYLKNTDLEKVEDDVWNEKTILINPVIKKREGLTLYWEACASCLDNMGLVMRPYKMKIEYFDVEGKKHQKTFKGFAATVLSHEYDHLDGILHMDKSLEIKVMKQEDRKNWRKTHGYEVVSEVGDFLALEEKYGKEYKDKCNADSR